MTNAETSATIATLPLDSLHAHPDNPRLQLREDVVDRLAAEIKQSGFGPEHALLVRPIADGHQVISGHHRAEAARRAGCGAVPCWVKDLDDDEAFMQLVLSNTQGELSPLEEGKHLSNYEAGIGGRGQAGGLRDYARRIGKDESSLRQRRDAYRVYENCGHVSAVSEAADRMRHLHEISKADRRLWPMLVGHLIKQSWTVADAKSAVDKIRKFDIPDGCETWLPIVDVVSAFLKNDRFNPATVERLIQAGQTVLNLTVMDGTDEDADRFRAWLASNSGRDSWDHRKISDYHAALIRELADRRAAQIREAAELAEAEAEAAIVVPDGIDLRHGDFREVLGDLEGKVDAIITDPPYPAEFLSLYGRRNGHESDGLADFIEDGLAEVAYRLLKPGGVCAVMVGQSYLPEILERMLDNSGLTYHWTLAYLTPGGQAVQLWQRKVNTFWKPVLIFTKGEYAGEWIGDVTKSDVNDNDKSHHRWGQSESGMADLIGRLTKPGHLVCDPFLGGGTTAVVCHDMSRKFVGCDVDETAVKTSVGRFAREEVGL